MKATARLALAGVCALAFSGVLLTGCANSSTDQQILDKLDTMESEINQLKGQQSGATNTATDATTAAEQQTQQQADVAANAASTATNTDIEASIADLEGRVATAVQTADAVAVPQDWGSRPQAYFEAKSPLDTLELEADMLEDQVEMMYRQGTLDANAFWSYDQRISAIENSLDDAADRLELRMGVDD